MVYFIRMIESQTIRELSRDPPTPHEIVTMLQEERDFLLTLPPASLNIIFKGFFSGERLGQCYTQKRWMPDADLLNAMLFAGQNNFENLQEYTYQHIQQLTVELRDSQTETIHSHNVPTDNIYKSLGIQERLVEDMLRRTGEKVIAHIYRSLLRTSGFIHYYNNLHNTYGLNTTFTPERAEIAYLATNLHDFEEDPIIQNDARIHVGKTKVIPHTHEPQHKQFFFLRRAMQSKRGRTTVQEDMQLDLDSKRIHYLQNALRALNSSQTDQDLIMEHLLGVVHEEYASIKLFNSESFV
ncbi:MAG TPA: hypothetical protein PLS49_02615 [Candidatus Woesebacteria bacterium]|nr:hypothetical protein [Candidatus Woesebacteria bacterium]